MRTKFILLFGLLAFQALINQWKCQVTKGYITALATDHSGKYLVTGGADGKVNIWDIEKDSLSKEIWFYGNSSLKAVTISPDNKYLAVAVGGYGTTLYSFPEGNIIKKIKAAGSSNLLFLPNGNLATVNYDGVIQIWDVPNEKILREFKPGETIYCPIAVSPDGKLLLTAAAKDKFKIYDLDNADDSEIFKGKPGTTPKSFAFSKDGKMFAVAGDAGNNAITIYNTDTKAVVRVITGTSNDNLVVFSGDNQSVYVASYKTVSEINITSGEKTDLSISHFAQINNLVVSDDGTTLLSGGNDISSVVFVIQKKWLKRRILHQELEPKEPEHGIGAKFGGGLVVDSYRTGDGKEHGLIMSMQDMPEVLWSTEPSLTNATSSDGVGNSQAMLRAKFTGSGAAGLCDLYDAGDFTDWHLPSADECARISKNIGYTKWPFIYWTSTELSEDKAFGYDFRTGATVVQKKNKGARVRAVRSF